MVNIGNRMRRLKTVSFYSVLTSPPIAKKTGVLESTYVEYFEQFEYPNCVYSFLI